MDKMETTDFLFTKIKKLYKNFVRPDQFDVDVWTDVLRGYSQTDILSALKAYRSNEEYNIAPTPGLFKKYLQDFKKNDSKVGQERLNQIWDYILRERPNDQLITAQRAMYGAFGVKMKGYDPEKDVHAPAAGREGF